MTRARDRSSADSIKARLLRHAKNRGEEFQRTLVLYANERLLYRLSRSPHRDSFVVKGASLFTVWSGSIPRATKDVDLLGHGEPSPDRMLQVFRDVLATSVEPDGLSFLLDTLTAVRIREQARYDGIRVTCTAQLGTAELALQVDVGFGDAVEPAPVEVEFPALLEMPMAFLRAYRREVAIAEKFHAMVELGLANSRLKDYFDIAFLASSFSFDASSLSMALSATFERRDTALPTTLPDGLSDVFANSEERQKQWHTFLQRVREDARTSLPACIELLRMFLWPVCEAIAEKAPLTGRWRGRQWLE